MCINNSCTLLGNLSFLQSKSYIPPQKSLSSVIHPDILQVYSTRHFVHRSQGLKNIGLFGKASPKQLLKDLTENIKDLWINM